MVYRLQNHNHTIPHFEVDSTESVWYRYMEYADTPPPILKLTPQSQYGIRTIRSKDVSAAF